MSAIIIFVTLTLQSVIHCNGANILAVVPTPSFSHQVFFRPLWQEYLKKGHCLTLITTDPMPINDPLLRQIDVSFVYDAAENSLTQLLNLHNDKLAEISFVCDYLLNATRRILEHSEVQQLFANTSANFDILLIENIAPEMFIFKQRYNVPMIAISSLDVPSWSHESVGNPTHPLLYPDAIIPAIQPTSGWWDRFTMVLTSLMVRKYYEYVIVPKMDDMIMEVFPNKKFRSILDLQTRVDMIFANLNPIFFGVRPLSPKTVLLTGSPPIKQNISKELQTFLDHSQRGVIYFSLGSNVKSKLLPIKLLETFKETFRQLPYDILWKYELNHMENQPKNVKITKWCPQSTILGHKNVKGFITQGGLQSLEEAIFAEVPLVTIPFFLDQEANAKRVVVTGLGVKLDYEGLTVDGLKIAILEVVTNTKYKMAAQKYAKYLSKNFESSLEDAVWWTEYLIKYKNVDYLSVNNVALYQYYYLDMLLLFVCTLIVFIFLCYWGCSCFKSVVTPKLKKQ